VALNVGAVVGPAIGAAALSGHGDLGPVWVAAALTGVALLAMVPSLGRVTGFADTTGRSCRPTYR